MKRLYAIIVYGLLMLGLSSCVINTINPLTGSTKDEETKVFEFNVSVVDTSAYLTEVGMRFSITFMSEDESVGLVILDKSLYWLVVDEVSTGDKKLHKAKVMVSENEVKYFELDENIYLAPAKSDTDTFLSGGRFYETDRKI